MKSESEIRERLEEKRQERINATAREDYLLAREQTKVLEWVLNDE